MSRFRYKKSLGKRRGQSALPFSSKRLERADRRRQWSRQQEAQWAALHLNCPDRASRNRLFRLITQMTGHDRGARESALAELELATRLLRAGFEVEFLHESQSKTADLKCRLAHNHIFVEVTALVGSLRRGEGTIRGHARKSGYEDDGDGQHLLVTRLLARITQKARQLAHYREPVVLAATLPHSGTLQRRANALFDEELDLKRLAGAVTLLLGRLRHVSAVLLSLWDVEPLPAKSGVRLANVHIMERSKHQPAYPRVRLLIRNPAAGWPLSGVVVERLKGIL